MPLRPGFHLPGKSSRPSPTAVQIAQRLNAPGLIEPSSLDEFKNIIRTIRMTHIYKPVICKRQGCPMTAAKMGGSYQ